MPRDTRLYMTFPNDFWLHPKIRPLSDGAFRAFVEINGYSRMQDLDGRVPIRSAKANWKPRALAELLANHPERPSLSVDGDDYVIWNYEEHQETKATRAERSARNTENGSKGGRPPKQKRTETQSVTDTEPGAKQSQRSESEIRDDLDTGPLLSESLDPAARDFTTDEIEGFRKALRNFGGAELDDLGLLTLVQLLLEGSPRSVDNLVGYVVRCTQRSPQKVRGLAAEASRQSARVREELAS